MTNDEMERSYTLAFSLEVNVGEVVDVCAEHTHCLKGTVLCGPEDEEKTEIGQLCLYWLQLDEFLEEGVEAYDALDACNSTTEAYGSLLYPNGGSEVANEIRDQCDITVIDRVLILDSLTIEPQYRGQDLGLFVVRRAMQLFGGCSTFVMMKPFPLQFSGCGGPNWRAPAGVKDVAKEFRSGVAKLSRHWARLGFQRIGRSPYYGFHMEHVLKIRPRKTRKTNATT